jgi:hypothetical protein
MLPLGSLAGLIVNTANALNVEEQEIYPPVEDLLLREVV